jgi:hypothetical protein
MAFKLKFQGKSKELYGSDNTMVRKGLVTPAYLMEGPGDKVKKVEKSADDKANKNLQTSNKEIVSTTRTKGKDEKGEYIETEVLSKRKGEGTDRDAWNENRNNVKSKYKSFDDFTAAAEAYRQKQKLESEKSREYIDKPEKVETQPKQEAKPIDKNIGTKIITEKVLDPSSPKRWDGRLGKYVPNYIDVKRRVAVSATGDDKISKELDQNVQYSSTGDADRIENVVTDQLEQKTVSNALDPATIIKGAMMVKNLIDSRKKK